MNTSNATVSKSCTTTLTRVILPLGTLLCKAGPVQLADLLVVQVRPGMHMVPGIPRTVEQGETVHRVSWVNVNRLAEQPPVFNTISEPVTEGPEQPAMLAERKSAAKHCPSALQALLYLLCFWLVFGTLVCAQHYPTSFATSVLIVLFWTAGPEKHAAAAAATQQLATQAHRLALQSWRALAKHWALYWLVAAKQGAAMRVLISRAYSLLHSWSTATSAMVSGLYSCGRQSAAAIMVLAGCFLRHTLSCAHTAGQTLRDRGPTLCWCLVLDMLLPVFWSLLNYLACACSWVLISFCKVCLG